MKRLIVKVCGMRDGENIRRVEALAPDWMGFICWEGSRRHVPEVPDYLPVKCRRVGVFVNPSVEYVDTRIKELELDLVQLHGQETPDFCRAVKDLSNSKDHSVEIIKAFGIATGKSFPDTAAYEEACDFFLFDTPCTEHGGSGRSFNWSLLKDYTGSTPFLLSGGLNPNSIGALSRFTHSQWAGIDLNSRFESSPGIKDISRLQTFINQLSA